MLQKVITQFIVMCLLSSNLAFGQQENEPRFSLVFGLNQPILLRGFNVEGNYWSKKWVADYSHGFNLHADGKFVSEAYENQKINFKITHSLGFGIGYRFTEALNVRFEPKLHVYQTYYEGDNQAKSNSLVNFNTYTLGLGLYYRWLPFAQKQGFIKGITIVPSLRYWQKVGSSLTNNVFSYNNKLTNRNENFNAPNIGIANTPWIFNISVGYSF